MSETGHYNPEFLAEEPDKYLERHVNDVRIPANLVLDILEQMYRDRKKRDKDVDNE